jgi:hypothetical protein
MMFLFGGIHRANLYNGLDPFTRMSLEILREIKRLERKANGDND